MDVRQALLEGLCIPAHPLALNAERKLDERRQRALSRYYLAAGAGGLAVGVHTTQFAIRHPDVGFFEPVLTIAAEEMDSFDRDVVKIGGICGETSQAVQEAELLRDLGYHAGLVSLAALPNSTDRELIAHARSVGDVIPIMGFYLQPAVGGRVLPYSLWREFVELEPVVAIKIAPFNRYQTLDVIRAIVDSGRDDIALYTGNDDNIVADLVTPFALGEKNVRIVGGLLGHWAVWTKNAVEILNRCHQETASSELLALGTEVTDCNAAFFDAANHYRGCIAGLHEVLRRQGLLEGLWCLDESECLSPGQREEIDRVYTAYPQLNDDAFVAEHLDEWLSG
ncbi:MAG: dihydrodipicolinate synthase family protein [Planctomycetaceae bacterium]|nr:dihydrodipicolinate synthase family protein [Planctomycetaceae bacterium]